MSIPDAIVGVVIVGVIRYHADSVVATYHGPVGDAQLRLIEAFSGPKLVEQVLPADQIDAISGLGFGVFLEAES